MYAFESLELEIIIAGVYESNIGSQRVLEKSGYYLHCRFIDQSVNVDNNREGHLRYFAKKDKLTL